VRGIGDGNDHSNVLAVSVSSLNCVIDEKYEGLAMDIRAIRLISKNIINNITK